MILQCVNFIEALVELSRMLPNKSLLNLNDRYGATGVRMQRLTTKHYIRRQGKCSAQPYEGSRQLYGSPTDFLNTPQEHVSRSHEITN